MSYKDRAFAKQHYKEYRAKNRAMILLKKKIYREANPEKVAEGKKDWYRRNKQRVMDRVKKRIANNPELHKTYCKVWRENHPVNQRNRCIERRAKLSVLGTFTDAEWVEIKKAYNNICAICKRPEPEVKLTIDHIIPISKGGPNTKENIQPLCKSCNSSKGAKIL